MSSGFPIGKVLHALDQLPAEALRDDSVCAPDLEVMAERLTLAAAKLRALAPLKPDRLLGERHVMADFSRVIGRAAS